jgi:hypothetical protein
MLKGEKSAAVVTIYRAPEMTKVGRRNVAAWLRRQADFLEKEYRNITPTRYRARYLYR